MDQPHRLHQLVMKGFPDGVDRQTGNVLHRLEGGNDQPVLLVQSTTEPSWHTINPNLLLATDPFDPYPNPAVRELGELGLENGRIFRFRLRANPTIRKSSGKGNKPGPRVPLVKEETQREWLDRKAQQCGFHLIEAQINPEGVQKDYRKKLTIYTILVNGYLQITDSEKFHHALTQGIGPGKAFGCGLLSLAPA